jgi:hypothetical protein
MSDPRAEAKQRLAAGGIFDVPNFEEAMYEELCDQWPDGTARLFAAAPRLLRWYESTLTAQEQRERELREALEALVTRAEREMIDPIDVGEIQHAKHVIAKSEGR